MYHGIERTNKTYSGDPKQGRSRSSAQADGDKARSACVRLLCGLADVLKGQFTPPRFTFVNR